MSEEVSKLNFCRLDSENLRHSSLSISVIKQDIRQKMRRWLKWKDQLLQSNETAIGIFKTLSAKRKRDSGILFRDDLNFQHLKNMSHG